MEGPSIVILCEEASKFVGKRVLASSGIAKKVEPGKLTGKSLKRLLSWGKHFILDFGTERLRVHFLMFGSYRIDEAKANRNPTLELKFKTGTLYLYSCAIKTLAPDEFAAYDWRIDPMSDKWDEKFVARLLRTKSGDMLTDVLLDQTVFPGVGNIIKNEVLFLLKLNPRARLSSLTPAERRKLLRTTHSYCHQFYTWKKQFLLKKNWKIFRKQICPECGHKVRLEKLGITERRTFWCPKCQKL